MLYNYKEFFETLEGGHHQNPPVLPVPFNLVRVKV